MKAIARLLAAAVLAAGLAAPAAAQTGEPVQCDYRNLLLSFSFSVLDKRAELSRFLARGQGAEPAYLAIRYGGPNDEQAETLLAELLAAKVRYVPDLAFAWSYGKEDGAVTRRLLGETAVADLIGTGGLSAMRAMVREGDEAELIEALAAVPEPAAPSTYRLLVIALLDAPDSTKARLASLAMERGLPLLAAGLVASQLKTKAWTAFARRLGDPAMLSSATAQWRWVPFSVGNPELPLTPDMSAPMDPVARERVNSVFAAAMLEPQGDFLGTLLNQTGRTDELVAAATAVRAAIEDGTIDPRGTVDVAWPIAYRALVEVWDDDAYLRNTLDSFEIDVGREGRRSPMDHIDWMLAVEALTPYLRKVTDEPPAVPDDLSPEFAAGWADWVAVATAIRDNPNDPALTADEATLPRAAELLYAADELDALAQFLETAPARRDIVAIARDMALRLDRRCASLFSHPSEALYLSGLPLFKFD